MSIGAGGGIVGSAAGAPLAQTGGNQTHERQQDVATQSRQQKSAEKSEKAGGLGEADSNEQSQDRDADGRRIWEVGPESPEDTPESSAEQTAQASKDPSGVRGLNVDLQG